MCAVGSDVLFDVLEGFESLFDCVEFCFNFVDVVHDCYVCFCCSLCWCYEIPDVVYGFVFIFVLFVE